MYTAISKLIDYIHFVHVIQTSSILKNYGYVVGIAVPLSEIVAFVLLSRPEWRLKGLYMSGILMFIFTTYIVMILTSKDHIPCNCGGVIEKMTWKQHFLFNLVFIILANVGIIFQKRISNHQKIDRDQQPSMSV
jgi:hypothetical protein